MGIRASLLPLSSPWTNGFWLGHFNWTSAYGLDRILKTSRELLGRSLSQIVTKRPTELGTFFGLSSYKLY